MIQGLTRLHDYVALVDGGGSLVWLSDGLTRACGADGELRGRSWLALLAESSGERELIERLERTGRLSNESVILRGEDGRGTPATISAARLGPPHGCGATVAIFRMQPQAEELDRKLRKQVRVLAAVLDCSPDGVVVVDRSRFITYANPAMAELTGYPLEELRDRPLALFLRSQEDVDRIAAALQPEAGGVRHHDLEVRRRDGRSLHASVSASLLQLEGGAAMGAVAYLRDVTERRHFEEDLARKNAELEHYVHAVSHDLRSPLVALLGFSRLLREDYADSLGDQGRHYLGRIEEAGRTMEALIHDLLELSRIGRGRLARSWVEPREVLLQLQSELKTRLEAVGASLRIPESPPPVLSDRTRLYQVFSNLVGNALEHMGPCSEPTIEIEVTEEAGGHELCVRDNGRGIPREDHERIFEIFQSLCPERGQGAGTGIGLAIVKKIAETHGGRVRIESEPGRGATFRVFLPST